MSLSRQIAYNAFIQTFGRIVSLMIGIFTIGLMTRYLGKEGFGHYTTITAFLQFFGIIVDFGLTVMTVQMISEKGAEVGRLLSNIFTLRFISAVIFYGLAPLAALFFPYPPIVKTGIALTAWAFLFLSLSQILVGLFQKTLQMNKVAIAEIAWKIALLLFVALAIYFDWRLTGVLWATVISSAVYFLVNYFYARKIVKVTLRFDFAVWRKIIKRSWPIAISIMFNLIYLRADILLLSIMKPAQDVGLYGAAYRVVDMLVVFPAFFAGLILPVLAARWTDNNMDSFKRVLQKSFDVLSMFALPLIAGTVFLGEAVMRLVAGDEFIASGAILQIIIFGCAAVFLANIFNHAIVAINQQKKAIWIYAVAAITSLIGYLILIPRYTYYGAAAVTVYSEILVLILGMIFIHHHAKFLPRLNLFLKSALASLVMGLVLHFMRDFNLAWSMMAGTIVYFGALFLIKGISKDMVKEIFVQKT